MFVDGYGKRIAVFRLAAKSKPRTRHGSDVVKRGAFEWDTMVPTRDSRS